MRPERSAPACAAAARLPPAVRHTSLTLFIVMILAGLLLCLLASSVCSSTVGYDVATVASTNQLGTSGKSSLVALRLQGASKHYDDPIYLLNLVGSRHEMGFDYGVLGARNAVKMYNHFLSSMTKNDSMTAFLVEAAADWQWSSFLSVQTPREFKDELAGMREGSKKAGQTNPTLDTVASRIIVLANMPGDNQDFMFVLIREFLDWLGVQEEHGKSLPAYASRVAARFPTRERTGALTRVAHVLSIDKAFRDEILSAPSSQRVAVRRNARRRANDQCSMFAAWGARTVGGTVFSGRNLDWAKDTGASEFKLITVWHPNDGKIAHATLGFLGLDGALAGMSAAGLTVHEANLESNEIGFEGFPWLLRLRYVMENASNLKRANELWASTNNTVGFNHMVSSASDSNATNAATVFETMFGYSAYFGADDPREAANSVGAPLKNAVWRTNHGYDPTILKHFLDPMDAQSWTVRRYMFVHDTLKSYEERNVLIDDEQALNITASVAGKTRSSPYKCVDTSQGDNILSVMFVPGRSYLYVAWENGREQSWRPAACNTYVKVEFDATFTLKV